MIAQLQGKWAAFSAREKWLIAIMLALFTIICFWLGVFRPIEGGLASAQTRHAAALDRYAAIHARVDAIKSLSGRQPGIRNVPLDLLISQSAAETGFTLDRNEPQGGARAAFSAASVRPTALFGWLAALETQGVQVESLLVEPTGSDTVKANGVLRASE